MVTRAHKPSYLGKMGGRLQPSYNVTAVAAEQYSCCTGTEAVRTESPLQEVACMSKLCSISVLSPLSANSVPAGVESACPRCGRVDCNSPPLQLQRLQQDHGWKYCLCSIKAHYAVTHRTSDDQRDSFGMQPVSYHDGRHYAPAALLINQEYSCIA